MKNTGHSMNINLLPLSYKQVQTQNSKFYKIQSASIYLLLTLIFLTSLTVAFRILQSQQIKAAEVSLQQFSTQVSSQKSKEAGLLILKNRLDAIDQISALPSRQRSLYNLVNQLIPPTLTLSFVSVDGNGNMTISLVAPNFSALDTLLGVLTSPGRSEGLIGKVSLESFSRSRDGLYRASLKIAAK